MNKIYTVGHSKIHGKGVFATKDIKKGDIVCDLPKTVVRRIIHNEKESYNFINWIEVAKNTWVNPGRTALRHLNHSCDPNAVITSTRKLVAMRPIRAGEEITFDYSLTDTDTFWHVACTCGASKCRKVIGSVHTLPKQIYRKKLHYIPKYARIAFSAR